MLEEPTCCFYILNCVEGRVPFIVGDIYIPTWLSAMRSSVAEVREEGNDGRTKDVASRWMETSADHETRGIPEHEFGHKMLLRALNKLKLERTKAWIGLSSCVLCTSWSLSWNGYARSFGEAFANKWEAWKQEHIHWCVCVWVWHIGRQIYMEKSWLS